MSKHFTPEQMERLEQRTDEIGQERIEESQNEWKELLAGFEDASNRGVDPASGEAHTLARKAAALIAEFSGGDAGIERSVAAKYRDEGATNVMAQHGWDVPTEAFAYMRRAMAELPAPSRECPPS